jgi:hypothetical protein
MEKQCDREIDHVTDQSGLGHTGYLSIDRVPLPSVHPSHLFDNSLDPADRSFSE